MNRGTLSVDEEDADPSARAQELWECWLIQLRSLFKIEMITLLSG